MVVCSRPACAAAVLMDGSAPCEHSSGAAVAQPLGSDAAACITVLLCYSCGAVVEHGQRYVTMETEDAGRIALHHACLRCQWRDAGAPADAQPCSLDMRMPITQAMAQAPRGPDGAPTAAATEDADDGLRVHGLMVRGRLLCRRHQAAAEGWDAQCGGCGRPMWLPPAPTQPLTNGAAPGADNADAGQHARNADAPADDEEPEHGGRLEAAGRLYHHACFRCTTCAGHLASTYFLTSDAGAAAAQQRIVCAACVSAGE
jgi:hypothetical protein